MKRDANFDRLIGVETALLGLLHELAMGACHDAIPDDVAFYVNTARKLETMLRTIYPRMGDK